MPEPSPASAAGTSAIAICNSGMNAVPIPRPIRKNAPRSSGRTRCACRWWSAAAVRRSPPPSRRPARASAPNRATRREVTPSDMIATVIVHGRIGETRVQRRVVADVLQVERAEEERRVHASDQEAAHDARARSRPRRRRIRSGMIGFSIRDSSARKAPISTTDEGAEAEHLGRAPAVAGGLDDRVDGDHQRHRDEDRAEPVDAVAEPRPRSAGAAPGRARAWRGRSGG